MRFRVPFLLLGCLLISGKPLLFGRPYGRPAGRPVKTRARSVDASYGDALAAANQFLHAWQAQDHEAGIMMLSDAARGRVSADKLEDFFSPSEQAAFEIQHGKRVRNGEYAFPVVLFGESGNSSRPHACTLVILRAGKNEWAVDRLP